tara:strand:- start:2669 stop:3691 length:1023 start_codon:yes stop_codon:yes gene_type:complete
MAIGRFIMMRGAQQAMQKYGPQMVQMALKNPKVKKLLQRDARKNEEWMKKQNLGDKRGRRDPYKEKSGDVQRPIQGDEVGRVTGPRDTLNPPRVERPLEFKSGGPVPGGIGGLLKTFGNMMPGARVVNALMNPRQVSSAAAQKFRAAGTGPSAMMNLQRMHSNVGRFPGGKGGGKGAGGGYGQMQRAKKKEARRMRRMMKEVAKMTAPQTYIDQGFSEEGAQELADAHREMYGTPNMVREYFASKNMGPTSVYGTMDELRAAGVDARPSIATSYGMPKNWEEEIFPYYEKHGTFEGAPDPRAVYEEDLSPLGIRSLPSQITENKKPYWWPEGLPWTGGGG